jgi:hypothetical protein
MPLNERGAYYTRVADDGRVIDVVPLSLGRARIILSDSADTWGWEHGW